MKLDNALLQSYINDFYGYGNLEADLWFVGMEEGVDNPNEPYDEINRRIVQWNLRGRYTVEDLAKYHHAIDISHFFNPGAKLQRTWLGLMKIMHTSRGILAEKDELLKYQIDKLARHNSQECMLELFPLPSKSLETWPYATMTDIDQLSSRKKYKAWIQNIRIEKIRSMIAAHTPKAVIFYGSSYEQYWFKIAEPKHSSVEYMESLYPKMPKIMKYYSTSSEVNYFIIPHPVARNLKNEVFTAIGNDLKAVILNKQ